MKQIKSPEKSTKKRVNSIVALLFFLMGMPHIYGFFRYRSLKTQTH